MCVTIVYLFVHTLKLPFFLYSAKARSKVTEVINNAIVHYREDLDLQNLIDFGQKEVRIKTKQIYGNIIYTLL